MKEDPMTLVLELPPALEQTIEQQARRRGVAPAEYALEVLEHGAGESTGATQTGRDLEFMREKNRAAIDLLDSWAEAGDEEIAEQRATWEYLQKALDEDRLSPDRPFFPKGSASE
jgi:hypothetical protein